MVKDYLVVDLDDNFYDTYIFEKDYKVEDIEKVIDEHKKKYLEEWTMESIEKEICKKFKVVKVIHCDYIKGNIKEV